MSRSNRPLTLLFERRTAGPKRWNGVIVNSSLGGGPAGTAQAGYSILANLFETILMKLQVVLGGQEVVNLKKYMARCVEAVEHLRQSQVRKNADRRIPNSAADPTGGVRVLL